MEATLIRTAVSRTGHPIREYEAGGRRYVVRHTDRENRRPSFSAWATPTEEQDVYLHLYEMVYMPLGDARRPSDESTLALLLGEPVVIVIDK